MNKKRGKINKKAQISVFVILGIAIFAVLLVLFLPIIKKLAVPETPDIQLSNCFQEKIERVLREIMPRGGSLEPELYYNYDDEKLEYLCYTNMWYITCGVQKPLLKQSIEREIERIIEPESEECIKELEDKFKSKGYSLETSGERKAKVEILPENIKVDLDFSVVATKDENKQEYNKFNINFKSKSYKIIMIATSIINWEAHYGDSVPETYMGFNKDIRVEKKKQSDGTTIYIISDRDSEDKFQFASRSLAWPPGYAIQPNIKE